MGTGEKQTRNNVQERHLRSLRRGGFGLYAPPRRGCRAAHQRCFRHEDAVRGFQQGWHVGFDPLGFSSYIDVKWLREAELKHGRICMLAWTGCIVQEVIHLPGPEFNHKFALEAWGAAPRGGMLSILVAIGLIEMISNRFQLTATDMFANPSRQPGNLGFDPLSLSTPKNRYKYELAEVTHGRAAMMGLSGIIHQMIITKQGTIEQLMNFKSVDPAAFKGLAGLSTAPVLAGGAASWPF